MTPLASALRRLAGERTVTSLARDVGCDRSHLSHVLNGNTRPSEDLLARLLDACDATEDQRLEVRLAFTARLAGEDVIEGGGEVLTPDDQVHTPGEAA